MIEKDIENKVKKCLQKNNVWFFKVHGGQFQNAGVPDLIVCLNGLFFGFEIKRYPNKLTPLQIGVMKLILKSNGYYLVIDQYNVDQLVKLIEVKDYETIIELSKRSVSVY